MINSKGFKINSQSYQNTLKNALIPFINEYYCDISYVILQDNGRCHISKDTINWFNSNNLNIIKDYPPYSPDFNAIEHIWKILKDYVEKRCPKNLNELKYFIGEAWDRLSMEIINNCIDDVTLKMEKGIENNGY